MNNPSHQTLNPDTPYEPAISAVVECDLVVIGGGLAGLSLACWLDHMARIEGLAMPNVCVLEPRTHYTNDRTWCFWNLESHPFDSLISYRWPCWQVGDGTRSVTHNGGHQGYAMIPADKFYRKALDTLQGCPQLTLYRETAVQRVEARQNDVLVTAGSIQWRAQAVVDTRPPELSDRVRNGGLWQLFTGAEIDCPGHGYALDRVHLMDFQPETDAISFIYLLPLGPNRLLVEWTEFHRERRSLDFLALLTAWLNRNLKGPYRIERQESGALPMVEVPVPRKPSRVVNAGVRGGWMRPATGYHFASCQRGCADLAKQILEAHRSDQWMLRSPRLRSAGLGWMDGVFLRALRRHPERAPSWFIAMFAGTTAEQMSRFMNDQPRLADVLALMRALPPGPFIREALR